MNFRYVQPSVPFVVLMLMRALCRGALENTRWHPGKLVCQNDDLTLDQRLSIPLSRFCFRLVDMIIYDTDITARYSELHFMLLQSEVYICKLLPFDLRGSDSDLNVSMIADRCFLIPHCIVKYDHPRPFLHTHI